MNTVLQARPRNFVSTPTLERTAFRALRYLKSGYSVHLKGPAGTGKTTLALHLADLLGRPIMLLFGDDEFKTSDLIGSQSGYTRKKVVDNYIHSVMKVEDELRHNWIDSRLTLACREGFTLVYDEFNRSRPEVNNVLLSALEEKLLVLPPTQNRSEYIRVSPHFRAIFTSNPEEYCGVHGTQDALQDRLITINMPEPDELAQQQILTQKVGIDAAAAMQIVRLVKAFQADAAPDMISSLRPSLMIATICNDHGIVPLAENSDFRDVCSDILLDRSKHPLPEATRHLWDLFNQFVVSQAGIADQIKGSRDAQRTARLHGEEEDSDADNVNSPPVSPPPIPVDESPEPAAALPGDDPALEESVLEEWVAEEPVAEVPVLEESVAEEPVAEEPVLEELAVEEPVLAVEEPVLEAADPRLEDRAVAETADSTEPALVVPVLEAVVPAELVAAELVSEDLVSEELISEELISEELVSEELVSEELVVEDPHLEALAVETPIPEDAVEFAAKPEEPMLEVTEPMVAVSEVEAISEVEASPVVDFATPQEEPFWDETVQEAAFLEEEPFLDEVLQGEQVFLGDESQEDLTFTEEAFLEESPPEEAAIEAEAMATEATATEAIAAEESMTAEAVGEEPMVAKPLEDGGFGEVLAADSDLATEEVVTDTMPWATPAVAVEAAAQPDTLAPARVDHPTNGTAPAPQATTQTESPIEERIFNFLYTVGSASFSRIETDLGLTRFQVVNALKFMLDQGLIEKGADGQRPSVYQIRAEYQELL